METPLEETVTRKGTGCGKVEMKAAWESKNSRESKYDEVEAVEEARAADIGGERVGRTGATEAVQEQCTEVE